MRASLGLLCLVAACGVVAIASQTVTEAPTVYEVHLADKSIEKGKAWPKTEDECAERARALTPAGSCVIRRNFTTVATCADEKAPKLYLAQDADGLWWEPDAEAVQDPTNDTIWRTVQNLYVKNPEWPGGYPNCWIRGKVDVGEWCVNGKDPAKVYMARKEDWPQECEDNEAPPVNEPTGRPPTP